jgi:hypothetical protein
MPEEFWEKNTGITPRPVGDEDIWRAAHQMTKRYGEKAYCEAARRSKTALELGDKFNYELWLRVVMAIQSGRFGNTKIGEVIH